MADEPIIETMPVTYNAKVTDVEVIIQDNRVNVCPVDPAELEQCDSCQ